VAEQGSLTRAGQQLHLTQSALSHQLLDLEERLGVPLFHRLGKRMVATPAGERLLETARRALPELVATEDALREFATGRRAVLRLSTECYTCYHWLPRVLAPFERAHPAVEVTIVPEATRQPIEALLEGRIDLGIVHSEARDERLTYAPLFSDEMVVVMAPSHRLAKQPFVRPEDMADEHLITYDLSLNQNSVFQRVLAPAGVTPRRLSKIQLTEAIVELVKAGTGIAVLARWAVEPYAKDGSLKLVRFTRQGFERQWAAVMMRNDATAGYMKDFVKLLARGPGMMEPVVRLRVAGGEK
jgi:LysR family transcriptional regulator for metE and metH